MVGAVLLEPHEGPSPAAGTSGGREAEGLEPVLGPTPGIRDVAELRGLRRLAHHQPATHSEKADGAFGRDGRRTERPGHHHVDELPQLRSTSGRLGPVLHDLHPVSQAQFGDGLPQEPAAPLPGVEKDERDLGSGLGQHQTGHSTTTAQVESPLRARRYAGGQLEGMSDVAVHRPRTEEPEVLRPAQNRLQWRGRGQTPQTARMTTRRRGSSPSEIVDTPSISFTVSCTTLRSTGDIGSKT